MGRKKQTDSQVHLRIDSRQLAWFKEYCQRNSTTMSDALREYIDHLFRRAERARRKDKGEAQS